MLVAAHPLHKELAVKVVAVGGREAADISHNLQQVQPLLQRPGRQVVLHRLETQKGGGQLPHLPVGAPITQVHRRQVVEGALQVGGHLAAQRHLLAQRQLQRL